MTEYSHEYRTGQNAGEFDEKINRTLRAVGSATPVAGMEDRIQRRLASANARQRASRAASGFFRLSQIAFGMAAAVIACAVIIAGSVSHSRHMQPVAPGLHLPTVSEPGLGAASAAHIASQPVTSLPQDRPRSVRKTTNGRAVISPDTKKPQSNSWVKDPGRQG
jgi:hypothetical protein